MSRATRPTLMAIGLIAALAATGTAQQGPRRAAVQRTGGNQQSSGLLGAFFRPDPQHQQQHQHAHQHAARHAHTQAGAVQPVGLLDRLRSLTDGDSQPHAPAVPSTPEPADWTGIPYHQPHGAGNRTSTPQPIRDPSGRATGSGVAQGGSYGSRVTVREGSSRASAGAIPTPPSEAEVAARSSRAVAATPDSKPLTPPRPAFSETRSSRRSGRRAVEPLSDADLTELEPAVDAPAVPHVAQRTIPGQTAGASSPNPSALRPGGETPPSLAAGGDALQTAAPRAATQPAGSAEATVAAPAVASADATLAANTGMRLDDDTASTGGDLEPVKANPAAAKDPWQPADRNSATASDDVAPLVPATSDVVGSGVAAATRGSQGGAALRSAANTSASAGGASPAAATGTTNHAVTSEVPGVRVVSQGPANLVIRQVTEYEILVENRGATEAPGVFVRTVLPQWVEVRGHHATRGDVAAEQNASERQLIWQVDRLAAGATERLSLRLAAERSGTFDVAIDWTLLPQTNVAQVRVQEPKLQLLIEGPEQVVYGESATYRVRVLNPGDGAAPNVAFTLSPNSATPQTQQIGNIPAGKEAQFEVELAAQDLGDLQIHGLATGDLGLRTEATKSIRVAAAKLEAVLTGPQLKYQDSEGQYALKVLNTGAAASRDIAAHLRLPAGVRYLGGLDGARLSGDTLTWQIDQLAPGASREFAFRCEMANTGSHLLAFDCAGTAAGKASVSIATRVEALADLVLSIADPPAPAPVGAEVTYEVTIRNRGSKAASDVNVVTHFSNGIEPVRVEGHTGEISLGQVQFATIPRIEAGQELRVRVVAQAAGEGLHRFRTEVTAGDTVLVAEEATRYLSTTTEQVSRRSSDSSAR